VGRRGGRRRRRRRRGGGADAATAVGRRGREWDGVWRIDSFLVFFFPSSPEHHPSPAPASVASLPPCFFVG
jgi:hypothetical protein